MAIPLVSLLVTRYSKTFNIVESGVAEVWSVSDMDSGLDQHSVHSLTYIIGLQRTAG